MATTPQQPPESQPWLVRPQNVKRLLTAAGVLLAVLVLLDFVVPPHGHFRVDGTFGFYAWFGFGSAVALIVFAKLFGIVVKRPEGYYDD
jgi:uncharacterized membrane protein YhdT